MTTLDLTNPDARESLIATISELISLNIVPIINTNDAVAPPPLVAESFGSQVSSQNINNNKQECFFPGVVLSQSEVLTRQCLISRCRRL